MSTYCFFFLDCLFFLKRWDVVLSLKEGVHSLICCGLYCPGTVYNLRWKFKNACFLKSYFLEIMLNKIILKKTSYVVHFFFYIYLFIYYVCSVLPACVPACEKRAPNLIIDGCEPPCGCWELNSGPLEEQSVLLTTEPSLQPCCPFFEHW